MKHSDDKSSLTSRDGDRETKANRKQFMHTELYLMLLDKI